MSSANRNYQEKRGFIRMKIDTPAHIELKDHEQVYQGVCRDLSGGGMLIEMDTALPVGTCLKVRITSAHGHAPMLEAETVVSRILSHPSDTSEFCLLGLEITELQN